MSKRELEELRRINGNKDLDSKDALKKIKSDQEALKGAEGEYRALREQNEDFIAKNRHVKDDIAQI
jgi:hypothetical protein